ncbi:MAG: response regulator [Patescibacteria group bacterium]|nr:response regulator [Patescibacteria group bacterium]
MVDDEQSLLDIFSQTLIAGGMQVVTANNGKDAFEKAKSQKPDIILLDQVLPDMNGNQVLGLIKKDPDIKNIPVAMLSNFTQNGLVDEAINAGALDYILKYQIEPKDLIAKVNDLIREHASKPGIADNRMNVGTAQPVTATPQPTDNQPAPQSEPEPLPTPPSPLEPTSTDNPTPTSEPTPTEPPSSMGTPPPPPSAMDTQPLQSGPTPTEGGKTI